MRTQLVDGLFADLLQVVTFLRVRITYHTPSACLRKQEKSWESSPGKTEKSDKKSVNLNNVDKLTAGEVRRE